VNEFSAEWLALREAADRRARSPALLKATHLWADRLAAPDRALRILDLGAGTGGNLRFLAPRLPGPQVWTLIDGDTRLLDSARSARQRGQVAPMFSRGLLRVQAIARDLAVAGSLRDVRPGVHLITASALFDLVSEAWCRRLIRELARPGAALLAALTYDGRIALDPPHPCDATVRSLFNRHQRHDKGFGPALGPAAARTIVRLASAAGARVIVARSDWRLGRGETALLQPLLCAWAAAAREVQPEQTGAIDSWSALREAQAGAGLLGAVVGHLDVLAVWPDRLPR
jgi:SAM-dependent methyltransferase